MIYDYPLQLGGMGERKSALYISLSNVTYSTHILFADKDFITLLFMVI